VSSAFLTEREEEKRKGHISYSQRKVKRKGQGGGVRFGGGRKKGTSVKLDSLLANTEKKVPLITSVGDKREKERRAEIRRKMATLYSSPREREKGESPSRHIFRRSRKKREKKKERGREEKEGRGDLDERDRRGGRFTCR